MKNASVISGVFGAPILLDILGKTDTGKVFSFAPCWVYFVRSVTIVFVGLSVVFVSSGNIDM